MRAAFISSELRSATQSASSLPPVGHSRYAEISIRPPLSKSKPARTMHSTRKRPSRPLDHRASAISSPTKTIPAVSSERTPADHPRQPPNLTSVQAHPPGPRKAPPPGRPSGLPATPPSPGPAARQRTARSGPRRRHQALQAARHHRGPAETAPPAVLAPAR